MPPTWNGQLVVTGAPGVRTQYANDNIISDWALSQCYAFASTEKPNRSTSFFANGSRSAPAQPLLAWHERVSQLIVAAKQVLTQRYGTAPRRTWMAGIPHGGYLTRWQPEKRLELCDGGDGWEGSLSQSQVSNLCTCLATALRNYPIWTVDPAPRRLLGPDPARLPRGVRRGRRRHDPGRDPALQTGTAPGPATA